MGCYFGIQVVNFTVLLGRAYYNAPLHLHPVIRLASHTNDENSLAMNMNFLGYKSPSNSVYQDKELM